MAFYLHYIRKLTLIVRSWRIFRDKSHQTFPQCEAKNQANICSLGGRLPGPGRPPGVSSGRWPGRGRGIRDTGSECECCPDWVPTLSSFPTLPRTVMRGQWIQNSDQNRENKDTVDIINPWQKCNCWLGWTLGENRCDWKTETEKFGQKDKDEAVNIFVATHDYL